MHTHTRAPRRALPRFTALGAAALAALGLSLGLSLSAPAPALAHDQLVDTGIEVDDTSGEVAAIVLSFNNEILDVGTEIAVTDEAGQSVAASDPEVSGRNVRQALAAPLAAGEYGIAWRVVSSDGHPIQGALLLLISDTGEGSLAAAEDEGEHEHEHGDEAHEHGDEAHEHGEGEHSEGDHEHGDEMTTQGGVSPLVIGISVAAGILVIGAVVAVVLGQRRRRQAFEEAAQDAAAARNSEGSADDETGEAK